MVARSTETRSATALASATLAGLRDTGSRAWQPRSAHSGAKQMSMAGERLPYKRPGGSWPQQGVVGPSLAPPRRATNTTWRRSSHRTRPSLAPARRRRQRSRLKVCEKARAIVGTPMFRALVTERRSMSTRPADKLRSRREPQGPVADTDLERLAAGTDKEEGVAEADGRDSHVSGSGDGTSKHAPWP